MQVDFPNCLVGWAGGWGYHACPRTRVGVLNLIFSHFLMNFLIFDHDRAGREVIGLAAQDGIAAAGGAASAICNVI